MLDNLYIGIIIEYKGERFPMTIKGVNAMSEYLDQQRRTEKEALEDIRKDKIKHLKAITDRVIKLCQEMQEKDK